MKKSLTLLTVLIGYSVFAQTAELNRDNQSAISFLPSNGNSIFHISHGLNNDLNISQGTNVAGGNLMTIKNSGLIGIGTMSPSQKLHVSSGLIRLDNWYAIEWGGSNVRIFGDNTGDYLRFRTGNIDRMHINANGNVGIGTSNPSARLTLNNSSDHTKVLQFGAGGPTHWFMGIGNNAGDFFPYWR